MSEAGAPTHNPDLSAVQAQLADTQKRLREQLGKATDADTIDALVREIVEVNHRITVVGSLIFTAKADKITAAAKKVGESKAALDAAIKDIAKLKRALGLISSFLALVDKVIDVAKLV